MNVPVTDLPRVVIIGGGFGGVSLAKKLEKKPFQVVMLDKRNYHTFQPLLYQVSTSGLEPDSIAYPIRKILKKNKDAYFRMAEVKHIDDKKRVVETNIGEITYDYLVIATGSKTNFFGNKSVEENAIWMKTVPQALNLRSLILENFEEATITKDTDRRKALLNFVIAGAGPTGVELSGAIAELRRNVIPKDYQDIDPNDIHIHLIEGMEKVLPPMSDKSSANAQKYLEELGVEIHLNTFVESYEDHVVKTNKEDLSFQTETFIWSAGVTGAAIEGLKEGALMEKANRYNVNAFNQIDGYENIFAIGDIALMTSEEFPKGHPMVAQPAIQQGDHLAKNLLRTINKQKLLPFEYFDKGTMATVGRNKAVVDLDKIKFGGAFAWFVWMFVHLWFLVGFRNRIVTFFNWTYSYINYDRAARLIVRPFKAEKLKSPD
ncbi:NAD(P)/FAD-dependent oxidoreductase [Psychroflexus montanilacus]|uniref:NAD(P)/FAD-dependent oxidoreductase n=1 Tax=Psychroflexus montanilacus TaxID=2873598 RepID=UPI001CCE92C4|nr:NAD(P)/FAD-dependent oxidoreductase [Psychroflexus montanilacus]MBZ9652957.1 NAD(P)/FAD-dependent oxidoreductase [Psychroflexus montanilacus]